MRDSRQLLRDYAERADEQAFRELVERYVNLVYSTALRRMGGDSHLAHDVTQIVFANLARKARRLPEQAVLGGWLYRDTVFTAGKVRRSEHRRQIREQEAAMIESLDKQGNDAWRQIEPLLDEAMQRLGTRERDALVLRFFEGQPLREVGVALGTSEDGARMRVDRALEKLRRLLGRQGVSLSTAALGTALSTGAVLSAPVELAATVAGAALTGTTATAGSAVTVLQLMNITGVKVAVVSLVVGASCLLIFNLTMRDKAASNRSLAALSYNELLELGHASGRDGDWRNAFACFQEILRRGSTNESDFLWATGAALAAGEKRVCEEFCRKVLEVYGPSDNPTTAERCAKQCLSLPQLSKELLATAAERADFAAAADPSSRWRQLAKGMAEYRRGNWNEALQWLSAAENGSQLEIAVQALGFGAMARHQLGDVTESRNALKELNHRLTMMTETGELCPPRFNNTWDNFARASAVRTEAEQLIFGKTVSAPLDSDRVRANRMKWQEVVRLMDSAEELARQGEWGGARDAFVDALAQPGFEWEWWELKQSIQAQKMSAVFLLAEDQVRYQELCRSLLARPIDQMTPMMKERYAWVCLSGLELLPDDLKSRALALAHLAHESLDAQTNPWLLLVQGVAAYREGQYAECASILQRARFRGDDVARARALLFQAMAYERSGQEQEARARLEEAEAAFARGARNAGWWNVGFYLLALKEWQPLASAQGVKAKIP